MTKAKSKDRHDLSKISAAELQAELRRREARVRSLLDRYRRLIERADALRAEIEASGGRVDIGAGAGSVAGVLGRTRDQPSLVQALKTVLAGKSLTIEEAAQQVLESGYATGSRQFAKIVAITLGQRPEFKRVERGRYTAG